MPLVVDSGLHRRSRRSRSIPEVVGSRRPATRSLPFFGFRPVAGCGSGCVPATDVRGEEEGRGARFGCIRGPARRRMSEPGTYVCQLPIEEKAYAAANLNETDEIRAARIDEIRRWILDDEDLHAPIDDFSILRFLRACKFNMEKTKYKFRNFYKQRSTMPEWFDNRNPFLPEMQEMLNLGVFLPLRKLDSDGKMIVVIRAAVHDPSRHKQSDVFKAGLMVLDLAMRDSESVSIHGITAILDLEGITAGHAFQLPPSVIKSLVHAWQGCYPLRIQSLDFVNAPVYVNVVLRIFKRFMSPKLKSRVHVHSHGIKAFCAKLPASILPAEYGGTDGTLKDLIDYWKSAVEDNREWFAEDEKYKVILHA